MGRNAAHSAEQGHLGALKLQEKTLQAIAAMLLSGRCGNAHAWPHTGLAGAGSTSCYVPCAVPAAATRRTHLQVMAARKKKAGPVKHRPQRPKQRCKPGPSTSGRTASFSELEMASWCAEHDPFLPPAIVALAPAIEALAVFRGVTFRAALAELVAELEAKLSQEAPRDELTLPTLALEGLDAPDRELPDVAEELSEAASQADIG